MPTEPIMRSDVPASAVPQQTTLQKARNRVRRALNLGTYKVHFCYLAPADIETSRQAQMVTEIAQAARELQRWYRWRMGNGKTFNIEPVKAAWTSHDAVYYSTHNPGGERQGWYWANALQEIHDQFNGGFYQEFDDWVVYLDADPAIDQYAGGASGGFHSGVCVLTGRDCDALLGQDPAWTRCRELGGCGHEAGHSLGLPHPPVGQYWNTAIMGVGYNIYHQCILTPEDRTWLNTNPHFSFHPLSEVPPMRICPFNDGHPLPTPRPRPTPPPRPMGPGDAQYPRPAR